MKRFLSWGLLFFACVAFMGSAEAVGAVPRVPDGLLMRAKGDAKVYYIQDGQKHYVSSPRLLESRFDWGSVIITTKQDLGALPEGAKLKFREGSLLAYDGSVYVIANGKRRPINSADAFRALGYDWSNVINVSEGELTLHPKGKRLFADSRVPDGTLIQDPRGKIYHIENGKRRYVPSPLIFQARFEWANTVNVTAAERDAFPEGNHIVYPDGLLVADNTGVFMMQDGKRLPIHSPEIFLSYGLNWRDVQKATDYELSLIPKGDDFERVKRYPDRSVVKAAGSPKLYQFDNGVLKHVPTPSVLESYGNGFGDVLSLPQEVMDQYEKKGKIGFANETLIKQGNKRFYILSGKKRPVEKNLYKFLCNSKRCYSVSDGELKLHATGEKYTSLETASIDGYQIPATSGKTAREQHLVRQCDESIKEHYKRANTGTSPNWLRNGFPRLSDGRGLGGAFANVCDSGSKHYSAVDASVKEEKYYITMRWNYLEWYEAQTQLRQKLGKDETTIKVKDASKWKYPDKEAGPRFTKTGYIRINGEIIAYKRKDKHTLKVNGSLSDGRALRDEGDRKTHGKGSTVTYVYHWRDKAWKAYPWTAYLDGSSEKTDEAMKWHKKKKVLVKNPENGKRIVASVLEAGPAMWTGRVSGLSPEAMDALGADIDQKLNYGFLVDQSMELGPVKE
jgi:hypothetical protein